MPPDSEPGGDEMERLRERLAQAGLLVPAGPARVRPDQQAVARARRAAGQGTPLSDLVSEEREQVDSSNTTGTDQPA